MGNPQIMWRLVASYPGPDWLVQSALYDGKRFACCVVEVPGEPGIIGGIALAPKHCQTLEHDPMIWEDFVGIAAFGSRRGRARAMSEFIWRPVLEGPRGFYAGEVYTPGEGGFPDGHWVGGDVGKLIAHVWIGAAPEAAGFALYDVTDGSWTPVAQDAMASATGMCVAGGYLWVAGRGEEGGGALLRYDGTDWVELLPGVRVEALFEAGGELHGLNSDGCFVWRDWSWQQIAVGGGQMGCEVDGKAAWLLEGSNAMASGGELYREGMLAISAGDARGLAGYLGRAWTLVEDGSRLAWADGAGLRKIVRWEAEEARLDCLARYRNWLWAFGETGGEVALGGALLPTAEAKALAFGTSAGFVEAGPWRVDVPTTVGDGEGLIAVGRLVREGVGQVVIEASDDVRLDSIVDEASSGTGETARLDEVRDEWRVAEPASPTLDELTDEASSGTGDSAELDSITDEASSGSGESASLDSLSDAWEVFAGADAAAGSLDEIADEFSWLPGPVAGEMVRFYVKDAGAPVAMVRVAIAGMLGGDWRALARVGDDLDAFNAWGTYEEVELGANHAMGMVGNVLRVAVVRKEGVTGTPLVEIGYRRG